MKIGSLRIAPMMEVTFIRKGAMASIPKVKVHETERLKNHPLLLNSLFVIWIITTNRHAYTSFAIKT